MEEEVFLTPEETLAKYGDTIIASVIKMEQTSIFNRQMLFGQLTPEVFMNENYVIYKVLYDFKEQGITPDSEFLEMYLMRHENLILNAKDKLDLQAFADLDENPVVGYISAVLKHFVRLQGEPIQPIEQFKLTLEKYKLEYKSLIMGNVYSTAKTILYDGADIGRKHLQGFDDSSSYVKSKVAELEAVSDKTAGAGFIDCSVSGLVDEDEKEPIKIGEFGIKELDKHFGGIYTQNFYSIIAPTKGGKSKFCTHVVHNVAVEHGYNIAVWAHEGGPKAWQAQMRAKHFDWFYNRDKVDMTEKQLGVSQEVVLHKKFKTDLQRELENASRIDLFSNPSYGNIHLIDRPFNVETFIDEIETVVQLNDAKIILIDYLQLIESSKGIKKSEAIGRAYQKLLAYCKKRNIACIVPAQFTQEFMKDMASSKDSGNVEVRTAGGESAEVIRTPDINIALYASAEDLIHRQMKLLSVPSRMASPFPAFDIYADLGTCNFCSMTAEE